MFKRAFVLLLVMVYAGVAVYAATPVSWMGTTFSIPGVGESDWAGPTKVDGFLISVGNNAYSRNGGTLSLLSDMNVGTGFGLVAPYYKSVSSNISSTGVVRLANAECMSWRNAANSANISLCLDSSNNLTFNGSPLFSSGGVLAASAGGTGQSSYAVGDTLYYSSGSSLSKLPIGAGGSVLLADGTAPSWGQVTNSQVAVGADVARSKLASGTAYRVLANSSSGVVSENAALSSGHVVYADSNGQLAGESILSVSRGGTGQNSYVKGDIIYSGATGASLTYLPIGTTGQILKVASGAPSWAPPTSTLAVSNKTSGYTLTTNDDLILADSSGGSLTLTLPTAASSTGKAFYIKKTDSSSNLVNLSTVGADKVDGINTTKFATRYDSLFLVSDGSSAWNVLSKDIGVSLKRFNVASTSITGTSAVPFATASIDTHSGWSTDTYTCQVPGKYTVSSHLLFTSTAFSGGANAFLQLYKNGSLDTELDLFWAQTGFTGRPSVNGSTVVNCAVGDTLQIYLVTSTTFTLSSSANTNSVSINRIGN